MEWISVKDRLPKEGKYVLARHTRGTWHDSQDQANVNCVVVKLIKGIDEETRAKMKSGEIPCEYKEYSSWGRIEKIPRWNVWGAEDVGGNNKVPYYWNTFGPDSFFGQDISHWMEIPKL